MSEHKTLRVKRYNPECDDSPRWETFKVPMDVDTSVLDALAHVKDEYDGSLSFRWSCRMAICGSCGVMVNGKPVLGCKTFLRDFDGNEVTVEPLANFPIERDLVADVSGFIEKIETVKPYLIASDSEDVSEGEYKQTPFELSAYQQFSMCINCGLCYAACPQFGRNPEFLGPAALTLAQRYNLDSRDEGQAERMEYLNAEEGVWSCTFVGYCSDVCPKGVDPAAAINRGKVTSDVDYGFNIVSLLKEKLGGKHDA